MMAPNEIVLEQNHDALFPNHVVRAGRQRTRELLTFSSSRLVRSEGQERSRSDMQTVLVVQVRGISSSRRRSGKDTRASAWRDATESAPTARRNRTGRRRPDASRRTAVDGVDAIVFTHGSDGGGKAGSERVDYGGVRNVLARCTAGPCESR